MEEKTIPVRFVGEHLKFIESIRLKTGNSYASIMRQMTQFYIENTKDNKGTQSGKD